MQKHGLITLFIIIVALVTLLLFLFNTFPDVDLGGERAPNLLVSLILVVFIGGGLVARYRGKMSEGFKHAAMWVALFLAIILGYSFRHDAKDIVQRITGELIPTQGIESQGKSLIIYAAHGGHFYLDAMVNAVPVRFLVDTGASDVTLSRKAAERIGFDLNSIAFTRSYNTANGIVRGAPITLDNISVEGITVRNVEASINEAPLTHSLLGMSYLNRFSSYSVSRDKLTLTP